MKASLFVVMGIAVLLGGCATIGSGGDFRPDGLPKQEYYVGRAGVAFSYEPLCHGHIYIVEENARKIFMTQPVEEDDYFDFDVSDITDLSDDEITQLKSLGIDPANIELSFYFVPVAATASDADND